MGGHLYLNPGPAADAAAAGAAAVTSAAARGAMVATPAGGSAAVDVVAAAAAAAAATAAAQGAQALDGLAAGIGAFIPARSKAAVDVDTTNAESLAT